MRKINLKTLLLSVTISVFIMLILLTFCSLPILVLNDASCGNEIFLEIPSPDNEYVLTVFQRDCGATTRITTHASILRNGVQLKNWAGNVFTINDDFEVASIQIEWVNNNSIIVKHFERTRFLKRIPEYQNFFDVLYIDYEVVND